MRRTSENQQTGSSHVLSRRSFLANSLVAGVAVAHQSLPTTAAPTAASPSKSPYAEFKMGIQSYSLRGFDAPTALKHTRTLGLRFWEAYPRHVPLGTLPAHIAKQKAMLAEAGIKLTAYGVLGFDANEAKARQAFDFARKMGIDSLSANPKKDKATFDLLDRMVEEYQVAIAIHNHGPRSLYDKISDVEQMVKDRHPLIGACVDTGHFLRSDEDPVAAIRRLGKRVFGVHLKDVKTVTVGGKKRKQFKIVGEGDLDVAGCLKELRRLKYKRCVALEYEENPKNPLSDLELCLKSIRAAVKSLS